jgi:hypothetical protein
MNKAMTLLVELVRSMLKTTMDPVALDQVTH